MKNKMGREQAMAHRKTARGKGRVSASVLAAAAISLAVGCSAVFANVLKSVQVAENTDGKTRLVIGMASAASTPVSFTTDNPPRVILDLEETSNGLKRDDLFSPAGAVEDMQVVEAQGRTRLIFSLTHLLPYEVKTQANQVHLLMDKELDSLAMAAGEERKGQKMEPPASDGKTIITNIDFRRSKNGEGQVEITFSGRDVSADINRYGNRIVASFPGVSLPGELEQRFDVTDFATPVTSIDGHAKGDGAVLTVTSSAPYEYKTYQSDKRMIINVSPENSLHEKNSRQDEKRYTGERLSLDFQDIQVRAALKIIADFTNQNIVASDSVTGNITLHLKNVPWDEALDIILNTKGLDKRRRGNVILVAPVEEIAARENFDMAARKKQEDLAPLVSETIQVNYAKASDLAVLFKTGEKSRATISIDERTNRILVTDTQENLQKMRDRIAELDIPVRQVMIDSRIVIANNDFSRNLGARFGVTAAMKNGGDGIVGGTGSSSGTGTMVDSALGNLRGGGTALPVTLPALGDRYNVNLPVINPAGKLALAVLGKNYLLDMELSALQMEGRGEVLSNPRVITSNRSEALIEQGVEIPYQQATSSGATSVSFKKAVLSLKVVPQITPDDRIIMDLNVTKDSVGQVFNGVPSINSREVKTQVLVQDGDTVVLGGIYEQTRSKEVDSVPLLGELPIIGALFRQTRKVNDKAELLIFVTPKIIRDSMGVK